MERLTILKLSLVFAALALISATMMDAVPSQVLHPCHPGGSGGPGGPGGPGGGPPCPPTPVPGNSPKTDLSGLVGFRIVNQTGENITLWLGSPIQYALNVPGNSELTYTVARGVYPYRLAACGIETTGFMDLTIQSFFIKDPCITEPLVRVWLENNEPSYLAVMLEGVQDFVIPVSGGISRSITIPRGPYNVEVIGCSRPYATIFEARADRTLSLSCP